jgi:DNA polymerase III alpha subunit (gram-positive type)
MSDLLEKGLLKYKKNQKYIVADYETCNLNLCSLDNKPWQVGYTIGSINEGITKSQSIYIKWEDLKISKDAARITRFNEEEYKSNWKDPKQVLDYIESYLYNPEYRILFFNGLNFDIYIHNIWRKALGLKSDYGFLNRVIDVRALVVADKLGYNIDINEDLYFWQAKMMKFYKRGFKSNLTYSCKEYGIEVDENKTHEGQYDCELTMKLFFELVKKFDLV